VLNILSPAQARVIRIQDLMHLGARQPLYQAIVVATASYNTTYPIAAGSSTPSTSQANGNN
jgi:hypothetical protein